MAAVETRDFFPPFGVLGGPGEDPWILDSGVDPLNLTGHREKDVLLIAQPLDPNSGPRLGIFGPFGEMDYPEDGEWGWKGQQVTLYVSATTGRSSANDDTPAKTVVRGRLGPSLNYGQSLFDGADPTRHSSPAQGEIELADPDSKLDFLLDYIWDGAPLILKRGKRGTPFSTWEDIGRFNAATILESIDDKRIVLRDLAWPLSGPLHDRYYDGTGGLGGDASLTGTWMPYAVGYGFNIEPIMISAQYQIMQFSFTPSDAIFDLRHGGVSIDFWADYPTFEALRDAAIPSGWWGSCLAHSLVRPNIDLQFGIRVDVRGDSTIAYGHPTPVTRASIARRVATAYGASRLSDRSQIDVNSFTSVETKHPALCGWYWSSLVSKADALNEIMAGILGYWRMKADGQLSIGYIGNPARGSTLSLAFKSYGMSIPRVVAKMPPRAGTLMAWRRNYGPQKREELALSIAADAAATELYGQAARFVPAFAPAVRGLYPSAQVVTVQGNFWNEADARVECGREQGLFEVERKRWQWDMAVDPHLDLTGKGVTLTDMNRLRAGGALPLLVAGMDTQGTSTTTFDLWG